jgi:hypothetical protein
MFQKWSRMAISIRNVFGVVAITCVSLPACSDSPGPGLSGSAQNLAELEQRLGTLRGQLGIPGLAVGIAEGDHIVWAKGLGFADIEQQKPPASTTDFHLASLTKGFAGVIIVKLVTQGLVSLDDPVSKYGVNISGDAGIKVRHLANMTSEGTPGPVRVAQASHRVCDEKIICGSSRAADPCALRVDENGSECRKLVIRGIRTGSRRIHCESRDWVYTEGKLIRSNDLSQQLRSCCGTYINGR